jgi:hypothetical protein
LKSIPSDNIKSIEVITTPPAKYDAEGNSGIVNIVLKKAKNDSWSAALRSAYRQGAYPIGTVGGNLNYQKGKLGISYDINASKGKMIETNKYNYYYTDETWNNNLKYIKKDRSFSNNFRVAYDVTPTVNVGTQYMGYFIKRLQNESINSDIFNSLTNVGKVKTYGNSNVNLDINVLNINMINKAKQSEDHITADIDYFAYNYRKDNQFDSNNELSSSFTNANDKNKLSINNFSTKIDVHQLLYKTEINYGAKISLTHNVSDLSDIFYNKITGEIIPELTQSDIFKYYENNYALYIEAKREFNKKWKGKVGLRGEFTDNKAISEESETEKTNNFKIFPTAYIQYIPNDNHNFTLAVNSRINRPSYLDINPNKWYYSVNSYKIGNPFLKPSYTYNLELSHNYKSWLNTMFYISKITDSFSGNIIIHNEQENEQISTKENYKNVSYLGISENISTKLFNILEMSYSFDVSYNKVNAYSSYLTAKYNYWETYTSLNSTLTLTKNFTVGTYLSYNFPKKNDYNSFSGYLLLNTNFRYVFPNKKLQISLICNDILKTNKPINTFITDNVKQQYQQYYDSQYFQLTLMYRFGAKIRAVEEREGNAEELNRVK